MKRLWLLLLIGVYTQTHAQDFDEALKAVMASDVTALKAKIDGGLDVNSKSASGQTLLSAAYFSPAVTEYLISKGADVNAGDQPALVSASRFYQIEVMKLLLKAGADPNKPSVVKVDLASGLRKVLEDEKAKGKKANKNLVKAYEDQIAKMPADNTITTYPIQAAIAGTNCKQCMELLLNAGAKTDVKNTIIGGNILSDVAFSWQTATQRGDAIPATAAYFESIGMKVNSYRDFDTSTGGSIDEVVALFKSKGADMEALDNNKWTPLKLAMNRVPPSEEVVMAFVNNGANVKATGMSMEDTPFKEETANPEKIKVRFDFPREGRNSNGGGYSANMDLVNPKPKKVALIAYYLYDPGSGKSTGGYSVGQATTTAWRTADGIGQSQVDAFYSKSIAPLKASFKESGIDLLTPDEFLDTDDKIDFYYGFDQESAKKEKTERKQISKLGSYVEISTLKVTPTGKGYRPFFVANEPMNESTIENFSGGIFSANRKLTSNLGNDLCKGLGVDAVVVVYITTRKMKMTNDDYAVNAVVTLMLGPNPGKDASSDPDAKNLGQFYCGTRTFYSSPVVFKDSKGAFGQYDGMGSILSAHGKKMCQYVMGKEKD